MEHVPGDKQRPGHRSGERQKRPNFWRGRGIRGSVSLHFGVAK